MAFKTAAASTAPIRDASPKLGLPLFKAHILMVYIACATDGENWLERSTLRFAQHFAEHVGKIRRELESAGSVLMQGEIHIRRNGLFIRSLDINNWDGRIRGAGRAHNVRILFARVPRYCAIFHKIAAVEGQGILPADRGAHLRGLERRDRCHNGLGNLPRQRQRVFLGDAFHFAFQVVTGRSASGPPDRYACVSR